MNHKPRVNRYANKRKHKRRLKQRHAMLWDGRRTNLDLVRQRYQDEDFWWWYNHHPCNGGYEYWKQFGRSGTRKYAKDMTNGVIRSRYRDMLRDIDLDDDDAIDDIQALTGADYEKMFDFWWTLW
jgi:hypothetical protein